MRIGGSTSPLRPDERSFFGKVTQKRGWGFAVTVFGIGLAVCAALAVFAMRPAPSGIDTTQHVTGPR